MKMDKSKTIEKINKLFILAENNANPGEKRSARAKAYQLMNQYDIDDSEVPFCKSRRNSLSMLMLFSSNLKNTVMNRLHILKTALQTLLLKPAQIFFCAFLKDYSSL